ncbi:hypothetical protein TURU_150043 [Turdus rufiventris]|nr:hypothetical protein TURU_150043 [Turdus rufiventris]
MPDPILKEHFENVGEVAEQPKLSQPLLIGEVLEHFGWLCGPVVICLWLDTGYPPKPLYQSPPQLDREEKTEEAHELRGGATLKKPRHSEYSKVLTSLPPLFPAMSPGATQQCGCGGLELLMVVVSFSWENWDVNTNLEEFIWNVICSL